MSNSSEARVPRPGAVFRLYRDLWQQMRGERQVFVGAVVLLISAQVVLLSVPYISGRALNALQLHGTAGLHDAALWLSLVLVVACGSWVVHGPGRVLERRAALTIRRRMSAELLQHLFQLPLGWHESHHSGATAHRVQQSTQALSGFAQSQFIYLNSAVRLLGPLVALWWVRPLIGCAAVAGFAVIISSVVGFDRAMLRLANQENEAERRYSATLIDTLGNTGTVYALRQARGVTARLERRLLAVFVPLRRAIVLNEIKWCTVDLSTRVLNCCLVALFVWLATRATPGGGAEKTLLLGSLYMVWEYAQQAAEVVSSIASHFQTFARQHADYASADIIRDAVPDSPRAARGTSDAPGAAGAVDAVGAVGAVRAAGAAGSTAAAGSAAAVSSAAAAGIPETRWQRMSIRDLTFHHSSSRDGAPALERLSFRLERGKRYALIGASGSGKSTLMRVLAGLYPAERVALTLDDGPIRVSPADTAHFLRSNATLIPQDAEVYEGTIGENLGLCESVQGPPAPNAYSGALEAACATDFVQPTPIGLEAPVAERASNWSGGQRSRVALARGILAACGSDLVLLDEPTASLDPATETRVYTNLFAAFTDACVISSIHRLSLLARFDEVLLMQEGRLVAQGSVEELMLTCPEFQRLTSLQQRPGETPGSLDEFPQGRASVA